MTPTVVAGVAQTLSLFSDTKSNPLLQRDKETVSQSAVLNLSTHNAPISTDTVDISAQSRVAVAGNVKDGLPPEVVKKENTKKEEATVPGGKKPEAALSRIQFVYDMKGELRVKYMDTSDRLIYQIPSEILLSLKEAEMKAAPAVDMKA